MAGNEENPRFPYSAIFYRNRLDENGLPLTDEEGNPLPPVEILRTPFGYRTQTGNTRVAQIITNEHKLAMPRHTVDIRQDDLVEITDACRTFWAIVSKAVTFNFGSNVWVNERTN